MMRRIYHNRPRNALDASRLACDHADADPSGIDAMEMRAGR
jgi:hypothetical protein